MLYHMGALKTLQHEVHQITRCRDMAIRVSWGHMGPSFWGKGGHRGSAMVPLERAMVVSYKLSIVTVALSVTIRLQFAIVYVSDAQINRGWVTLGSNFRLPPWSRSMMFGSAESERPTLTNVKLFSKNSNLRGHNPPTSQTDGRTDWLGGTTGSASDQRSEGCGFEAY